jgi:hypothetical protein
MPRNRSLPPSHSKHKRTSAKSRWVGQLLMALGGLLLVGVLAWGLWPLAKSVSPQPTATGVAALKADKDKIDLGDVHLGNTVSAAFQLTNAGDKPLHFTKAPYIQVVAGC